MTREKDRQPAPKNFSANQSAKLIAAAGTLIALYGLSGCSGGDATARLSFAAAESSALTALVPATSTPNFATSGSATTFKMKLIAAYLTEDIDPVTFSNSGVTSMIYLNSDCQEDIMHCDLSAGTAEDGAAMDKIITTYFDFSSPTAANTALNTQARDITTGTYKYARLEFCKYNSGDANNITWGNSSTGDIEMQRNSCTVNSAELVPALEVAASDTVTITLSYDIATAISTGSDATGDDCEGSGATKACFTLPTFTPSASK